MRHCSDLIRIHEVMTHKSTLTLLTNLIISIQTKKNVTCYDVHAITLNDNFMWLQQIGLVGVVNRHVPVGISEDIQGHSPCHITVRS